MIQRTFFFFFFSFLHCTSVRFATKQLVFLWVFAYFINPCGWGLVSSYSVLVYSHTSGFLLLCGFRVCGQSVLWLDPKSVCDCCVCPDKCSTFLIHIYVFYLIEVMPLIVTSLCCNLMCFYLQKWSYKQTVSLMCWWFMLFVVPKLKWSSKCS